MRQVYYEILQYLSRAICQYSQSTSESHGEGRKEHMGLSHGIWKHCQSEREQNAKYLHSFLGPCQTLDAASTCSSLDAIAQKKIRHMSQLRVESVYGVKYCNNSELHRRLGHV